MTPSPHGLRTLRGPMATVTRPRSPAVGARPAAATRSEPAAPDRYLNRELSTLQFQERVLAQAENPDSPLLERAKFAAIVAGSLDEFYQVRVAGLKRQVAAGTLTTSPDGLTAAQQLARIDRRVRKLAARHAALFTDEIRPALAEAGVPIVHWSDLDDAAQATLRETFEVQIFPVLTPLAVDPRTRSRTSRTCRSTWRCWCATRRAAAGCSPGSRCRRSCRASCSRRATGTAGLGAPRGRDRRQPRQPVPRHGHRRVVEPSG